MSTSFLGRILHRAQHADWSALGKKWGYRGLMVRHVDFGILVQNLVTILYSS